LYSLPSAGPSGLFSVTASGPTAGQVLLTGSLNKEGSRTIYSIVVKVRLKNFFTHDDDSIAYFIL